MRLKHFKPFFFSLYKSIRNTGNVLDTAKTTTIKTEKSSFVLGARIILMRRKLHNNPFSSRINLDLAHSFWRSQWQLMKYWKECSTWGVVIWLFVYSNTPHVHKYIYFLLLRSWLAEISFMISLIFVMKLWTNRAHAEKPKWNKQTKSSKFDWNGCVFGACWYAQLHKNYLNAFSFQLGTLIRFDSHLWFLRPRPRRHSAKTLENFVSLRKC